MNYIKFIEIPSICPVCGSKTEIRQENNSKILVCTNPNCKGKLLGKLTHFVSKNAMNIDGLSEATIEKLIDNGLINKFSDIYRLRYHGGDIESLDGFGQQSTINLIMNIEESKTTTLSRFINALCIPLVGKTCAKLIADDCNNSIETFIKRLNDNFYWSTIDGVGNVVDDNITKYYNNNYEEVDKLASLLTFQIPEIVESSIDLTGKTFVITGSLNKFTNRDEAKDKIESLGGKVAGSVSKKTSYLVNNDINSTSGKNKKAKELNIPIITEDELIEILTNK